ncbi:hypothetical protein [Anaerospora hongkongensis]|uniref:hypothetical protein n=1 Tax=Anaerospora hongkongensis TaxID=244830 RepID=UPI0028A007F7|nr:hypothetical protein [Anaerospora hongkongensis]
MEIARSARKENLQILINNHYGSTGYVINEENQIYNTNLCKQVSSAYVEQKDGIGYFRLLRSSSRFNDPSII